MMRLSRFGIFSPILQFAWVYCSFLKLGKVWQDEKREILD